MIETKEPDELRFKADDGNIGETGSNQNVTVVADLLGDDVDYGNEDEYFVELSRGTDDWNRIWAYGNTTDYKFTVASRYKNAGCTATKVNNPLNDNVWNEVRGCIRAKDYAGPAAKASNAFVTYVAGVSSGVDTTDIYCPKALSYLSIGHDRNIENSSNYTLIANVYTYNHYLPVDGGSRERSTESERSQADGTRAIEPMKYAEESVVAEPDTYVLYREENVRTTDTHSKE